MNKYDNDGLLITSKHVFFFKNKCPFSNFYECSFFGGYGTKDYFSTRSINKFFCSEQYFMWMKALTFKDEEIADAILKAKTPQECKALGRKVRNYNDVEWNKIRFDVMLEANMLKFLQNDDLKKFIKDPRFDNKKFVEASPYDGIWGIKKDIKDDDIDDELSWHGTNLQGKVIDKVRAAMMNS